ncbi:MAG TPA: neutral/alkaline non-lysosomal ceramidase N-terminal domain-containing protein [Thermoguttaceae bacterium]|nr:neutral/alkaline non-lysosomal ceramidase N-terminal domain-containing protein [Thermoguttaceae bacterium]
MKSTPRSILLFAAVLVVAAFAWMTVAVGAEADWRVGLAQVSITPEEPVWLYGYAGKARFRPCEGVSDDIYAQAMAVAHGDGEPAVLIVADLCVLREPEETALGQVIVRRTGLERRQILLNWSHTHSGPMIGTSDVNRYPVPEEDLKRIKAYTETLWNKLADVAAAALADMRPARLSWGAGQVDFVLSRRAFHEDGRYRGMSANPDRYADRTVPVLRIDAPDGRPRGVVFGCACHAVTLGSQNANLSGDYPGFARRYVESQMPGVQAMFVQGCGADANPHPRSTPDQVEVVERQGRELGVEVCRVASDELEPIRGPLRVEFERVDLPMKPAPPREELDKLAAGPFWKSHNARRILEAQQRNEPIPTHYRAPLALWQFGDDLTLVGISGEVVSDYVPLVAETIGPGRLWVAGYCNQVFGYLPSAKVVSEGGYETLGLVSAHIGWFSADAQDVLLAKIRAMSRKAGGRAVP